MNVFEIIGIVLLALIIIATLLLLFPVGIIIKNNEKGFKFFIKIAFVKFDLNSNKKKSEKKTPKPKKKPSSVTKAKEMVADKHFTSLVSNAFSIFTEIIKEFVGVFKHISIKKLYINCICGGVDSAETAIEYGKACAVVYPFVAYLHSLLKIKESKEQVLVQCDFLREKSFLEVEIEVSVKIVYLALAGIRFLKEQLKSGNLGR